MTRRLRFFDILCLGVNAIVGSGIFLIPGRLVGGLGPASVLLFALCGVLLLAVALCFAEASSRVDRNGGPYNYARIAFGEQTGFAVGWIAVVTALLSYAAVASGLPHYIATWWPAAANGWTAHAVSGVVIFCLAALNYRGVVLGARTTDLFTVSKIIPLVILAIIGVMIIRPAHFTPIAPHGWSAMSGLILAVVFTYQGFEVAPVPSGETVRATSVVPRAVLGSLLLSMVLYMVLQAVVISSGADVAGSERPLADTAATVLGPWGATLIAIGAVISMVGYCAGLAFGGPRYLTVLCEDGFLPKIGAWLHPRFETPGVAVMFVAVGTFVLTLCLDFDRLVDLSAFTVTLQFFFTCAAIPFLRKKIPDTPTTYRLPGGWIIPLVGVAVSVLFLIQIRGPELRWSSLTILGGFALAAVYRWWVRRRSPVEIRSVEQARNL